MSPAAKKTIAVGFAVFAAFFLVYGTYLPLRKSRLYISALQTANKATSLQDFMVPYMTAFEAVSPIGQEEIVRNFANTVGAIATNAKGADPTLIRALGASMDRYSLPLIEERSGLSQAQSFYTFGATYRALDQGDDTTNFRERYHTLLLRGLELSPNRPQFLYGLFDYELHFGSNAEARKYGELILKYWPDDKQVQRAMKGLR